MVNQLDAVYGALADRTRREIIDRLRSGPLSVTDVGRGLDMSLPAIVKHITVLERAGILLTTKAGRIRTCTLAPEALDPAEEWIATQRLFWNNRLDALADHLEENP